MSRLVARISPKFPLLLAASLNFHFALLSPAVANTVDTNPLQSIIEDFRAKSDIPAIGAAVIDGGKVEFAVTGVRKFGEATPASLNDKWHIGSMTKSMTALLVAMAIEEKRLKWTSTPDEVFSDFEFHPDYRKTPITRFLTHTAGIDDEAVFGDDALIKKVFAPGTPVEKTRRLLAEHVLTQKPHHALDHAQSSHRYSNVGFMIVGAMLEKIYGEPWEKIITRKLFSPLKMSSCGFGPTTLDSNSPAKQPWGHRRDDAGNVAPIVPGPIADNHPALGPAGTVHCSLEDLTKYSRLHLDLFNGRPALVSPGAAAPLYRDVHGVSYSPGALVINDKNVWSGKMLFWHNGSNTYNYSAFYLAPKLDKAVIITTNFGVIEEAAPRVNELFQVLRPKSLD